MGLLAALKAIGAQLLGFKFLFTIFQERTRAYYLHQGLTLGSAQYIATGRGYTMSSNFVKLFSWYARSHFYCGIELLFMTLNYYAFTSSGGRHFTAAFSFAPLLANTWPVLLPLPLTRTIAPPLPLPLPLDLTLPLRLALTLALTLPVTRCCSSPSPCGSRRGSSTRTPSR